MHVRSITLALVALVALFTAKPLFADSIQVITTGSGSSYNTTFDLVLTGAASFSAGNVITVTGLTGVSAAAVASSSSRFGTLSSNGTSVTFTVSNNYSYTGSSTTYVQLFTAATTSVPAGTAAYSIQEASVTPTGTVTAVTPEPSSLLLLGTGSVAWASFSLRRRRQAARPVEQPA